MVKDGRSCLIENLYQGTWQLSSMTRTQRNCHRFTMATKVTVTIMRSSLKIFETVFHFSHSSFAIDLALVLHFAIFFHHSYLISLLNLLGTSNWTPHLHYVPSSQPGYPVMAELIFLNYQIQWAMTDFFQSLSYLVCQFKTSTVWLLLPFPDLSPATSEFPYSFSKDALCFPTCSSWLIIFPLPGMPSHLVAVFQHMLLRI